MDLKTLSIILFAIVYILLMALPEKRAYVALMGAGLFVAVGILPLENVMDVVNWNVIMMIAGTMGIIYFFIESKMPALMADVLINNMPNVKWAIISLSLFAGVISAFVDNVATVLMVAPIALTISKKLKISPVPMIIAISVASNIQGAATLVGDTTCILLAGAAKMNFLDFFVFDGKIGMFWVVQVSMIAATLYFFIIFKNYKHKVKSQGVTKVTDFFPSVLLLGTIVLLIVASFLPNMPENINGYICMGLFFIGLFRELLRGRMNIVIGSIKEIDYFTLLLLTGLFIIIGGISHIGVVKDLSDLIMGITDDPFILYTIIVWLSVLLSAFIDNIPYIATMLPVIAAMQDKFGPSIYVLYFGLLAGATLGGNLTPIGASANITALGILRKDGYEVNPLDFMKISVPYTLAAVITGYILIWVIYY